MSGDKEVRKRKSKDEPEKKEKPAKGKTANDNSQFGLLALQVSVGLVILSVVLRLVYMYVMQETVNVKFQDEEGVYPPNISYPETKWGSLRPGNYFGMKSTAPSSLVTGIMWFRNAVNEGGLPIRHWCNQWDRGMKKYTWTKHDFDSFGTQEIIDDGIRLNTSFIIHDESSWSARISVNSLSVSIPSSLIFYVALDEQIHSKNDTLGIEGDISFPLKQEDPFIVSGWSNSLGDYKAKIYVEDKQENVLFKSFVAAESYPALVHLKETVLQNLAVLRNKDDKQGNLFVLKGDEGSSRANFIAHQIIITGEAVIRVDFVSTGSSTSTTSEPDELDHKVTLEEVEDIDFDDALLRKSNKFTESFERIFRLKSKGFSPEEISFAEAILSNMIGGVGYFYGSNKVASESSTEPLKYGPHSLLSAVPSRSFFPRGFLWDEGFHNLLISRFNPSLSSNIIKSWLSLMNNEGWIPREVILGSEAEERVPKEYIVQKNTNANPPTLFLTLESMMDQGSLFQDDLGQLFPRLQAWFSWFNTTQVGKKEGTYRWKGRNPNAKQLNPLTLTSGLDDYPRASHPTEDEYHVDLRCWMVLASRVMSRISFLLNHESHKDYKETADYLSNNELLDKLHWSEENGMYCDFGLHSKRVELVKRINQETGETSVDRKFLDEPTFSCVNEFGYVSLFPLLLQVLKPDNPRLGILLEKMRDPKILWTDYGLRSLSKQAFYYDKHNTEQDAPYWRSPIWLNMNFLALKTLYYYGKETSGPFSAKSLQIYQELRGNIIKNMVKQYKQSGFIWENYSDKTGEGRGCHPFTGWSALVVLIMAEKY